MSTTITCSSCGHGLPVDVAFCTKCGDRAHDIEETVLAVTRSQAGIAPGQPQCGSCNAPVGDQDVHCGYCGARTQVTLGGAVGVEAEVDEMMERLAAVTGDEYEIIQRLGQGGMGSVYLARETALQRFVAIKVLAPELAGDPTLLERFRTEARIVAAMRHRSIIGIYGVRHNVEPPYFIMDYVEGASLDGVIKSNGPLSISVVKGVLYEVGAALDYAHKQGGGIIHRDIKPANVMLDPEGVVIVMDFGISKAEGATAGLTVDGSIIGTPEYMSPEQCRGNDLTVASDQYALGLLGYTMLSGAPPFSGHHFAVLTSQIRDDPVRIDTIRPDCPLDLADSIHRMLSKAPLDRWSDIREGVLAFGGRPHDVHDPVRVEIGELVRGFEGATRMEVPASRLSLNAPSTEIAVGDELAMNAEVFDDLGRALRGRSVMWSTSDPDIVAVSDEDGRVLARAPGSVVIRVTIDELDAAFQITVRAGSRAAAPESEAEAATVMYVPPSSEQPPSQDPAAVVVEPSTDQDLGRDDDATIIYEPPTDRTQVFEDAPTVLDEPPPAEDVAVEDAARTVADSPSIRDIDLVSAAETLLEPPVAGPSDETAEESGEPLVLPEPQGKAEIAAASVAEVRLTAAPLKVRIGSKFELKATAFDADGNDVEVEIEWRSSDASVTPVSLWGEVTARASGKSTITAVAGGVEASVQVSILTAAEAQAHKETRTIFRRFLLPGLVFQSVVIAGGYGTGRELVEFFLQRSPLDGLMAMGVTMVIWSAVSMVTFELARMWGAYDYRHFFQKLLGERWWLFEVCYVALLMIVLAVVAAASGSIAEETFGLSYWTGVGVVMVAVGALVFGGNAAVERFFTLWSFVLFALYIVFFLWCFNRFGPLITETLTTNLGLEPNLGGWLTDGLMYAGYNLAVIPPVLATLRLHETRRETFIAGALTGPIAMLPGLLFFLAMVGQYPSIVDYVVPANQMLEVLGSRAFQVVFQLVLFGTLIETGAGLIHAVNERISGLKKDEDAELATWMRPLVAIGLLGAGTLISRFGLIDLIAVGYGTLTIGFIIVYVIPVLTLGVWKVHKGPGQ